MLNFIIDNEFRILLEIEQNGILAVICFINVIKNVHTVKIIKIDFRVIIISSPCPTLASSN